MPAPIRYNMQFDVDCKTTSMAYALLCGYRTRNDVVFVNLKPLANIWFDIHYLLKYWHCVSHLARSLARSLSVVPKQRSYFVGKQLIHIQYPVACKTLVCAILLQSQSIYIVVEYWLWTSKRVINWTPIFEYHAYIHSVVAYCKMRSEF